jgi:hypothetical protein
MPHSLHCCLVSLLFPSDDRENIVVNQRYDRRVLTSKWYGDESALQRRIRRTIFCPQTYPQAGTAKNRMGKPIAAIFAIVGADAIGRIKFAAAAENSRRKSRCLNRRAYRSGALLRDLQTIPLRMR